MVLDYPFVWPLWNAAENSQRQVYKQSLTFGESITCDRLCLASHLFPRKGGALGLVQEFISGEALEEYALKDSISIEEYTKILNRLGPRRHSRFTVMARYTVTSNRAISNLIQRTSSRFSILSRRLHLLGRSFIETPEERDFDPILNQFLAHSISLGDPQNRCTLHQTPKERSVGNQHLGYRQGYPHQQLLPSGNLELVIGLALFRRYLFLTAALSFQRDSQPELYPSSGESRCFLFSISTNCGGILLSPSPDSFRLGRIGLHR